MLYLNGRFVTEDKAKISVFGPGFLSGFGLFETMRAYNNKIVYLARHFERIKKSGKLIGINFPYPLLKFKKVIHETVEINGFRDAYVRLTAYRAKAGTDILIIARKYHPCSVRKYRKGFSANISRFKQNENSFLARIKTTNRLFYELNFQEAKAKGFDEAIILNSRGYLAEATRSNIFLVKDKEIFTPALECGCLDGITRRVIFDLAKDYNFRIYEGKFTAQDLREADEAFLTNSLMGVMPLTSLERRRLGRGTVGRLSKFFLKEYNFLLKNGS